MTRCAMHGLREGVRQDKGKGRDYFWNKSLLQKKHQEDIFPSIVFLGENPNGPYQQTVRKKKSFPTQKPRSISENWVVEG